LPTHPRIADYGDDLAVAHARQFQLAPDLLHFVPAPDKLRQSAL
jgi:hypothetical protein